tara:strand:- start:104802 stop:106310 length:1509 start_codon:yes stop_codon:yes gene_type:complete
MNYTIDDCITAMNLLVEPARQRGSLSRPRSVSNASSISRVSTSNQSQSIADSYYRAYGTLKNTLQFRTLSTERQQALSLQINSIVESCSCDANQLLFIINFLYRYRVFDFSTYKQLCNRVESNKITEDDKKKSSDELIQAAYVTLSVKEHLSSTIKSIINYERAELLMKNISDENVNYALGQCASSSNIQTNSGCIRHRSIVYLYEQIYRQATLVSWRYKYLFNVNKLLHKRNAYTINNLSSLLNNNDYLLAAELYDDVNAMLYKAKKLSDNQAKQNEYLKIHTQTGDYRSIIHWATLCFQGSEIIAIKPALDKLFEIQIHANRDFKVIVDDGYCSLLSSHHYVSLDCIAKQHIEYTYQNRYSLCALRPRCLLNSRTEAQKETIADIEAYYCFYHMILTAAPNKLFSLAHKIEHEINNDSWYCSDFTKMIKNYPLRVFNLLRQYYMFLDRADVNACLSILSKHYAKIEDKNTRNDRQQKFFDTLKSWVTEGKLSYTGLCSSA